MARLLPALEDRHRAIATVYLEITARRTDETVVEGRGPALADIRHVIDRALTRLHLDLDRRAWLRPIHSLGDTFITRLARQGVPPRPADEAGRPP